MICLNCKNDKDLNLFPPGYKMICTSCKMNKAGNSFKRVKSTYDKMIQYRTRDGQLKLQESLWDKMNEQWDDDFDIDADSTSFINSQDMDDMMEKYEHDLIKVLSGLEEKLPDWYGIEVEEEE